MNKAYVYRLYPTADQKILFAKTFGCCRKIWNLMLGDRIDAYNDYGITLLPAPAWYKSDDRYSYLKEVDSLALTNVQLDQQRSFTAFYNGTSGYPKFKSKRRAKLSYTTNNQGGTISVADKSVRLPKAGMVKARIHRKAPSYMKLKSATVSCDKCGRYYVSILYEYDRADIFSNTHTSDAPEKLLGLDYKSDGLYVDSEGRCADMPHYYRQSQKRLKHLQRGLPRKVGSKKGETPSNNFRKQLAKIRKLHKHIASQRKDYLHKRSAVLVNEYDLIGVEDLSLKGMSSLKGLKLGKATNDNGYAMFIKMLEYKLAERGKYLIKVGKTFPSSQLCQCGYKNPITKDLSVRTVVCPVCGRIYDRDVNAAINIRNEAYRIFRCRE
ncbi:MAG: RNA-guided endonuclease TnpB family protein [Lachnospiraceae bacterium]|nr:RNA-guided endonuclease TnpB family protein [Lachnospiraceae bacterium]